ncbi:histidine kinase [Nocardioides sp. W7]|uniref:sensor histidine kinase n=1 Tax=Nocardioides sp. W7 TaxID=2931390 RepID=UPI001FD15B6B|nr:histidine kinase [Nocardioides sp. W7]
MHIPLSRHLGDPVLLRRAVYVVAAIAVVLALGASTAYPDESDTVWVLGILPLALVAGLALPGWRAGVAATTAGFVAAWTGDGTYLWPVVAAAVLVSVVEDEREVPLAGWVGGTVGSVFSLVLSAWAPSVSGFLATALGGGLGLLVRARLRTVQLVEHTEELEQQARWLEQRTALARELHDVVGHHVTAMVVQAEAGLVGEPERALSAIGELGRTALTELDALVVHLRDPDVPLTVTAPPRLSDVDELLAAPLRMQGVDVRVRIGDDLDLDEVQVLTVYRILQEALTNVARHARAGAAAVEVVRLDRHLRVRVTDDGIGTPAAPGRGSGLLGIEERVAAQGGSWEIAERLGGGTVVDVVLPIGAP